MIPNLEEMMTSCKMTEEGNMESNDKEEDNNKQS